MKLFFFSLAPVMSFKKSASGNWQKHFYVKDYLGSTRKVVKLKLDYQNYVWSGGTRYAWLDGVPTSPSDDADFAPYNDRETNSISRLSWLGKEKDSESNLGDHGVRKYSNETGRFLSVDPLWEKYLGWTPYQYAKKTKYV